MTTTREWRRLPVVDMRAAHFAYLVCAHLGLDTKWGAPQRLAQNPHIECDHARGVCYVELLRRDLL